MAIAIVVACACSGSDDDAAGSGDPADGAGDGGVPSSADFGNVATRDQPAGGPVDAGANTLRPSILPGADCLLDTQEAVDVPVDVYVMLDKSGSMLEETGTGETKWDAIRSAIAEFVSDPASEGLGVGLQYFPLRTPGVPDTCRSDADCGDAGGPCMNRACVPGPASPPGMLLGPCVSDGDCAAFPVSTGCEDLGQCSLDPGILCLPVGSDACAVDGECEAAEANCLFWASCDVDAYGAPAVAIDVLPDNAGPLMDSLGAEMPFGLTPTSSALAGAIERAATHQRDNPGHKVIAVLATDGLPTDCLPVDIDEVAAIAADGLSALDVETHVIGVFSSTAPEEAAAPGNLDRLAMGGGTGSALIVDAASDVTQQFLDALDRIRRGSLGCEFRIPGPPEGSTLDYLRVNVTIETGSRTTDLYYVERERGCSEAPLGWYYDVPPGEGEPTRIQVCDAACEMIESPDVTRVDVRLGCDAVRPD